VAIPPLYGACQIVLGLIVILVLSFRPNGLLGDRELLFRAAFFASRRRN
jgi:branched-chain amino acid transport system permease protein